MLVCKVLPGVVLSVMGLGLLALALLALVGGERVFVCARRKGALGAAVAQRSAAQRKGATMQKQSTAGRQRPHPAPPPFSSTAHLWSSRHSLAWIEPPRDTMPVIRLAASGTWRSSTPAWMVQ